MCDYLIHTKTSYSTVHILNNVSQNEKAKRFLHKGFIFDQKLVCLSKKHQQKNKTFGIIDVRLSKLNIIVKIWSQYLQWFLINLHLNFLANTHLSVYFTVKWRSILFALDDLAVLGVISRAMLVDIWWSIGLEILALWNYYSKKLY